MANKPLTIALDSREAMDDWKVAIQNDIETDDGKDAKAFVGFYTDFLKANPTFPGDFPTAASLYDDLFAKAMWLALPYLSERDGLSLFESRLATVMAMPTVDIWDKVRQWLLNFAMESRDDIRAKINDSLLKSAAPATKSPIKVGETSQPGTVAYWVNYYRNTVGEGVPDPLKQTQFFFTDKTFNAIPPEERENLKRLLTLVDKIWYSSFDSPGFEEDIVVKDENGTVRDFFGGEELAITPEAVEALRKVRRGGTPEEERARLSAILRGPTGEAEKVGGFEDEYKSSLGGDQMKLRDAIFAMLAPTPGKLPEAHRLVALLKQLARAGALDSLLRSDRRFFDLLAKHYSSTGQESKVDDLKVYPTSPGHLCSLLQLLLEDSGGLEEEEAARFTVQLANIMQKQGNDKYIGMAYLDEDSEEFEFSEPLKRPAAEVTV